jgi:hypothetical protein
MRDPKDREVELSFWESIRSSDSAALIRTYLEKYPEGEFNTLAQFGSLNWSVEGRSERAKTVEPRGRKKETGGRGSQTPGVMRARRAYCASFRLA